MPPSTAFQPLPTGIATLDDLLTPVDESDPAKPWKGFAHLLDKGFFGVIFGASCSGKSVLSLQLASRFVTQPPKDNLHYHAVYLTQEPKEVIQARALEGFGFLTNDKVDITLGDLAPEKPGKLTIVQVPLDPAKQQARLIDVFELINARFCCDKEKDRGTIKDAKQYILVGVDNAETIRFEAYQQLIGNRNQSIRDLRSDRGRREFCKLLREYCHRHRLRSWFSFEENSAQSTLDEGSRISTAAETYAADGVIRLGATVLDGNFLERSLEIVKARDQFYRRGRHHFAIRGFTRGGFGGPSATPDRTKTGIIVFPSLPTQLHRLSREVALRGKTEPKQRCVLGIENIDKEVRLANMLDESDGYLSPGTVTVLVADLDSVGTDLALHFVAQKRPKAPKAEPRNHWLYISFHHDPHMLREIAGRYKQTMSCVRALEDIRLDKKYRCLFLPPEHISDSKLLYDIDTQIRKFTDEEKDHSLRVVVDDLYELDKRFPLLSDKDDFIAALCQLFRQRRVIALLVDTVEVGEGRNPLEQSVPAGMADHVLLLRHIEFQTRMRKVFSILKLAEHSEPSLHWDLDRHDAMDDRGPTLTANAHRFQFFKGLLSNRPEPVEITLSLYADSPRSPQHLYLQKQQTILSKTFGQHIEIHPCHPEDYAVLQQTVGQAGLTVLGDCHIISVDEIWLDELIAHKRLEGFRHGLQDSGFHWDKAPYVTVAHDLACEQHGEPTWGEERHHFAIPDRHNCGVLAYYSKLKAEIKGAKWIRFIREDGPPSWGDLAQLQTYFMGEPYRRIVGNPASPRNYRMREPSAEQIVEIRASGMQPPKTDDIWGAFTFNMENRESCVSFLLELVLSRLKPKEDLVDENRKLVWKFTEHDPWVEALTLLLRLLDPWDIGRLADAWFRPSPEERPCLYSRQWFTSWGALGCSFPGLKVMELPKGLAGEPTSVSGTWYLAMRHGSSAISAGKALIACLTSPEAELHRLNNGIGMPTQIDLYEATRIHQNTGEQPPPQLMDILPTLPYAKQFAELPGILGTARIGRGGKRDRSSEFHSVLRTRKCPFHRPTIKNYAKVSPVLMGLMVRVARAALLEQKCLTDRSKKFAPLRTAIEEAVAAARARVAVVTRPKK